MTDKQTSHWKICIDTGGTFTDCFGIDPGGNEHRCKVLSSSSLRGTITGRTDGRTFSIQTDWNAPDNFVKGFTFKLLGTDNHNFIVEKYDSKQHLLKLNQSPGETPVQQKNFEVSSHEEAPVLAARLLTQTPAGKPLPMMDLRLGTTKGTNALLEKNGDKTVFFITKGFKDLLLIGEQHRKDIFSLNPEKPSPLYHAVIEVDERIDCNGNILVKPEYKRIEKTITRFIDSGITSAAICLMNSYKNDIHEKYLAEWLQKKGFKYISVSSDLSPLIKIVPRARTADVNAYLAPVMEQYFDNVSRYLKNGSFKVMTSAGGLVNVDEYTPKDSLLSGPAGGVVGAASSGKDAGFNRILSFDMGGTSTDVARYEGDFDYDYEHQVGDAILVAPALSIETVAAGGGSICSFDGHALQVGPKSASADPGPACYGSKGPLTITDVNLLLGRLHPSNFHFPVEKDAAAKAFKKVSESINNHEKNDVSDSEILEGFLDIANERMAQAIRKISLQKGFEPSEYALVSFGGAGAQHACAIADKLNISTILISQDAGLLSARGLAKARIERFSEKQTLQPLDEIEPRLRSAFKKLEEEALNKVRKDITGNTAIEIKNRFVFARFKGQDSALELSWDQKSDIQHEFKTAYIRKFGHWIENRTIEIESLRVIAATVNKNDSHRAKTVEGGRPDVKMKQKSYFNSIEMEIPVFDRKALAKGGKLDGPVLILDPYSTTVVEPGWQLETLSNGTVKLTKAASIIPGDNQTNDIIKLELFTNRFASLAEQMGEILRRTSLSVNIKERLDFSCALFDRDGFLVVNAPHIPVHLGAMGLCVRTLIQDLQGFRNLGGLESGDVIITNHPAFGGSHLPDITVVTPVFYDNKRIGFTASRAHHAEIGGKSPGSMPADARNLAEEGVVIPPMLIVKKGRSLLEQFRKLLEQAPYPSRTPDENLADIEAAIAANNFGASELQKLADVHSPEIVQDYMIKLRRYAGSRLENTLQNIPDGMYQASEKMDDGSLLKVSCDVIDNEVTIDFTGSAAVHPGNLNANPSIVNSVVMYVLRLLIHEPLPLNDGLLDPVKLIIPEGILNPRFPDDPVECPAVVGGNIETSQRLTDTLLKAFEKIACSQGTMNNVLFGNKKFGYYETVGGGSGAGEGFHGTDAVHHHMTNTRATDPEILEHRYPVRLDKLAIRKNSGGAGKWKGGDGIIKKFTFLEPVQLTVLTQHRNNPPYGLNGGRPGKTGKQWVERVNGKIMKLDWQDSAELNPGDRFILQTPGGGGFGNKQP